jgi:ubiquinone/menaquinone biosynthesis C-methylase UbiE
MENYKREEAEHYSRKARERVGADENDTLQSWGYASIEEHLRAPYLRFQQLVVQSVRPDSIVLELGAGTGVHSIPAALAGAGVIATDISLEALGVARLRAQNARTEILLAVADAECLPIRDGSIDVITSAGVFYCLNLAETLPELTRALAATGKLIAVDSFNHNPVYRLNRLLGRVKGSRTRRATTNIPDNRTLDLLRQYFASVTVEYFGVWTFLWPVLYRLLGRTTATRYLEAMEPPGPFRRYAFKVVVVAAEPRQFNHPATATGR